MSSLIRFKERHANFGQLNDDRIRCGHRQYFIVHLDAPSEAVTYVSEEKLIAMTLDALEQVAVRASKLSTRHSCE